MGKKLTRGGKRVAGPGKKIGRPPTPGAKVAYGTKLDPVVVSFLRSCDNAAVTIEDAIKRSAGFKKWNG